jgi:hypothetical protein
MFLGAMVIVNMAHYVTRTHVALAKWAFHSSIDSWGGLFDECCRNGGVSTETKSILLEKSF